MDNANRQILKNTLNDKINKLKAFRTSVRDEREKLINKAYNGVKMPIDKAIEHLENIIKKHELEP